MAAYVLSSRPGKVFCTNVLAWLTLLTQSLSEPTVQVYITSANPASFPPIEMVTSDVAALSELTCPLITSAVTAPEHAAKVNVVPAWFCAHSTGYACELR